MVIKLVSIIIISFYGVMIIGDEDNYFFSKSVSSNYLLDLVIPSINFEMKINDMESEFNDVDYGIELLEFSNINNNVYFFASHSGSGDNCYFNRVKELDVGDNIYIYINNHLLVYEVVDIYNILKNGYMEVDEYLEDVIFLITCHGYNRQLIVKGLLINRINL